VSSCGRPDGDQSVRRKPSRRKLGPIYPLAVGGFYNGQEGPAYPAWDCRRLNNRDAAEIAATNGAQITDVYSSIFPGNGPNTSTTADVLLPFTGTLTSATLSFAGGDFQSDVFGALAANINEVSVPFSFADGRFVTAIHSFTLNAAELAAANLAGEVDLHLDRNGSGDFIAFDWFELVGTTSTAVPEPATLSILGAALAGLGWLRRRRRIA